MLSAVLPIVGKVLLWAGGVLVAFVLVNMFVVTPHGAARQWLRRTRWRFYDSTFGGSLWGLLEVTGIAVFVGPNGSGKSLAMVHSALATLDGEPWECDEITHRHHEPYRDHVALCGVCPADPREYDAEAPCPVGLGLLAEHGEGLRLVYSTVRLTEADGRPHPLYRELSDYRQLITIEHSDVFFDEVAGVSDSSESATIPVQVKNWMFKLRKVDVRLRVTTPDFDTCSKPIRQACQVLVDCRAYFEEPRRPGRLWRPNRAMVFRAYDGFAFRSFSSSNTGQLRTLARSYFWRVGSRAENHYDTLSPVTALGHVDEHGMCMVCGGGRSRPRCACPSELDDVPVEHLHVVERLSPSGTRVRSAALRLQ